MYRHRSRFIRSGDEPLHARSALRLRLVLACFGLVWAVAGAVLFAVWGYVPLEVVCVLLAAVALVNIAVVAGHLRAGPHYQPGPDVPPYRPLREPPAPPTPHEVPPVSRRRRRYVLAFVAAGIVLANAWTWVQAASLAAAGILSVLALLLIVGGVIAADIDSPILTGREPPPEEPAPTNRPHQAPRRPRRFFLRTRQHGGHRTRR